MGSVMLGAPTNVTSNALGLGNLGPRGLPGSQGPPIDYCLSQSVWGLLPHKSRAFNISYHCSSSGYQLHTSIATALSMISTIIHGFFINYNVAASPLSWDKKGQCGHCKSYCCLCSHFPTWLEISITLAKLNRSLRFLEWLACHLQKTDKAVVFPCMIGNLNNFGKTK